ncbi:MAG: hypothetical protein J6X42_00110 [Alphaproteobacteria bacterium]|nr:hypothetical protein [Alphaproteobacteria bacterium]
MKKSVFNLSFLFITIFSADSFAETINYYDENGRLIKAVGDTIQINEYNEQGKNIAQRFYASEDDLLQNNPTETRIRTFRADGKLDTIQYYTGEYVAADNPTPTKVNQYEYEGGGKSTGYVVYKEGVATDYASYNRETPGTLITTTYKINSSGEATPNYVYYYTYNEQGDKISEIRYKANNLTKPNVDNTYTYQYDRYGNIEKMYTNGELTSSGVYDPAYINKLWLANRKLIYTVEEAREAVEAAGTDTVNFRIRYK